MNALVSRPLFAGLGAFVILACSGSSSGGGASSGASFVHDYCQLLAPCCGKLNKPTDGKACELFLGAFTGTGTYDPVKGQACLDATRASSSSPDFCTSGSSSATCNSVYTSAGGGTKKPGDSCTKDGDCAPSTEGAISCATSFDSTGGQTRSCQLQIDGKVGDTPCLGTKSGSSTTYNVSSFTTGTAPPPPARGYICDVAKNVYCNAKTSACTAIAAVGQDCDPSGASDGCVTSAFCDYLTKKCVARLALGADCSSDSTSCADKLYCDQTSKKCTATSADGAPCVSSQECASKSCVNKACTPSSSGGSFVNALVCGS